MGDAAFVGSIPEHYDSGLGPVIFVDCAAEMARRAAALAPRDLLETAAGTGIVTRALRSALPSTTRIVATDLNAPMLEVARRKFTPDEAVTFQPADAMALPFADETFDAVVCQFGIMFFPDKAHSLREVRRVLRRGGTYLLSVWDSHRYNAFGKVGHETVSAFFPEDPPQFQRLPYGTTFEEIKEAAIDAGFDNLEASLFRFRKPLPEPERLARGVVRGNPLIEQIKARGTIDPQTIEDRLTAAYREAFPDGSIILQAMFFALRKE